MPSSKIPAGYKLKISLQNATNGNVTGATYHVTDDQGNTVANRTLTLQSISGVSSADLAPIIAFELNLVGPINGESAVLTSGAGTIVYEAGKSEKGYKVGERLTAMTQEPPCAESGYVTAETANSYYGVLPPSPSYTFTQSFAVSIEAPMIRKQGKLRPSSIIPPSEITKRT